MADENPINKLFDNMMSYEPPKIVKEYDDTSECLTHGKYVIHVIEYDNGDKKITPTHCPICEEERKAEERERTRERYRQERLADYKASNISPEYFDKEFSDYIPTTKAQKAALDAVQEMVDTQKGKIVIIGSNGVGKTMLGSLAVKAMGGYIYTMYEIATRIRQSYSANSKETELEIVNELANAPLLVIDEVGRLKMSEAVQDWFSFIIDKRHTRNKPLILLGNLHFSKFCKQGGCPKCFEKYFDCDGISRLRQNSKIIEIVSNDKRSEENKGSFITDER